jgi:hypothetical protein
MKILHYDAFAGISGDMNLAALIDLGVDPDHLRAELGKLGLDEEFGLDVRTDSRCGIHGTRVDVRLHPHRHHHDHDGAGHTHGHGHDHGGHGHHHHAHRGLADITAIIGQSALDRAVKDTSLALFRLVAEAEARVHGTTVDKVHFHEVGATDSIVDLVGAAICLESLGVDAVWASPVELGAGTVRCAHGVMPVPAPATEAILHGVPTTRGGTPHEATTPTGAAILAGLAGRFVASPTMTVLRTGYGIGHRETQELPNVLRVHLAEVEPTTTAKAAPSQARLLQCNIDDMTAEALGEAMDLLMEHGAMDVHFTPIVMKKSRPATSLALLCGAADEERFKNLLFRHTTTLGVKSLAVEKTELERKFERLDTPLGPVTMKHALRDGRLLRSKPEFEDCRALARKHGLPLAEVYALVAGRRPGEDGNA